MKIILKCWNCNTDIDFVIPTYNKNEFIGQLAGCPRCGELNKVTIGRVLITESTDGQFRYTTRNSLG